MTNTPNGPWFDCLPNCEAQVPCGAGRHTVRWEAGSFRLPAHPDAAGEMVLAALGAELAGCVELAQVWGRHTSDLSVLAVGPRGPADQILVGWDDVAAAASSSPPGVRPGRLGPARFGRPGGPGRVASHSPAVVARATAGLRQMQEELEQARLRRTDMLSLLALGYGFQVRLAGQVIAAHADQPDERARPALVAAITGRLALVAQDWLGIDPDQVTVTLHTGSGWGTTELTGPAARRRLRVRLPAWWLARVWACGLALTGGHLVVAVERAGWPDAQVLGLRAPGAEPVPLDVHAAQPDGGLAAGGDTPHWEI
jgi:hypothetical protein